MNDITKTILEPFIKGNYDLDSSINLKNSSGIDALSRVIYVNQCLVDIVREDAGTPGSRFDAHVNDIAKELKVFTNIEQLGWTADGDRETLKTVIAELYEYFKIDGDPERLLDRRGFNNGIHYNSTICVLVFRIYFLS